MLEQLNENSHWFSREEQLNITDAKRRGEEERNSGDKPCERGGESPYSDFTHINGAVSVGPC